MLSDRLIPSDRLSVEYAKYREKILQELGNKLQREINGIELELPYNVWDNTINWHHGIRDGCISMIIMGRGNNITGFKLWLSITDCDMGYLTCDTDEEHSAYICIEGEDYTYFTSIEELVERLKEFLYSSK